MPLSINPAAFLLVVTVLMMLPYTPVFAQEIITEQEFLASIAADHPASLSLKSLLADPERKARGAGLWPNPSLWFERESPEIGGGQSKFGVSWTPPLDGRRSLARNAAKSTRAAARSELALRQLSLRIRQRGDFAAWAIAQARVNALARVSESATQVAEHAAQRAAAGEESRLVAQRLSMAAAELSAEFARAEADLASARVLASTWLGQVGTDIQPALPDLPPPPATPELNDHPTLAASHHLLQSADFERRLGNRWLEMPSLDAGWLTQDGPEGSGGPVIGLTLGLPLFDRRQGDRAAAEIRFAAQSAQVEFETAQISAEWAGARESYDRLRRSALEVRPPAPVTDSVLAAAAAAFRAGETTATDFLETMRAASAFQTASIELYTAALEAHRRLEAATGHPLPAN